MTRALTPLPLLTVLFLSFLVWGNKAIPSSSASMPWAVEVYREYCPELTDEAYIEDCWTGYVAEELHLVVVTDTPTLVSSGLDTIPILTTPPPSSPPAPLASLPHAVEVYRAYCPELLDEVGIEDCWTGYVGEELRLVVVTDTPETIPSEQDLIPILTIAPPPPAPPIEPKQGSQEASPLSSSPASSARQNAENSAPQPGSSIAGIPYATAMEILRRQTFMTMAGVISVWLDANGIVVLTDQPDLIPSTFEGLPVRTEALGEDWVLVIRGNNASNAR